MREFGYVQIRRALVEPLAARAIEGIHAARERIHKKKIQKLTGGIGFISRWPFIGRFTREDAERYYDAPREFGSLRDRSNYIYANREREFDMLKRSAASGYGEELMFVSAEIYSSLLRWAEER